MLTNLVKRCLLSWSPPLRTSTTLLQPTVPNLCLTQLRYGPISVHSARKVSSCSFRMADNCGGNIPEGEQPVKTAKQLKKEAQKREKKEKFLAKQAKKDENQKAIKVR